MSIVSWEALKERIDEDNQNKKEAQGEKSKWYMVAMLTDRFLVDSFAEDVSFVKEYISGMDKNFDSKGLDVRIFNEETEYRLFRSDIGHPFHSRIIVDTKESEDTFLEVQFLDIDTRRSVKNEATWSKEKGRTVKATGGGEYRLPMENMKNVCVVIKNYIAYDENTNIAYIKDWRLCGFKEYDEVKESNWKVCDFDDETKEDGQGE